MPAASSRRSMHRLLRSTVADPVDQNGRIFMTQRHAGTCRCSGLIVRACWRGHWYTSGIASITQIYFLGLKARLANAVRVATRFAEGSEPLSGVACRTLVRESGLDAWVVRRVVRLVSDVDGGGELLILFPGVTFAGVALADPRCKVGDAALLDLFGGLAGVGLVSLRAASR